MSPDFMPCSSFNNSPVVRLLFVGREEFNGNPQESARCRSSNGRYARLCRVTRDQIHQFGFRSLDWVLILAQKLQKTAMKVCFPCLCMRRVGLAPRTPPFQVNRNDEGIAIASSSFFLNAHPSWVVCVGKHGCMCSSSFTMLARISSSFVSPWCAFLVADLLDIRKLRRNGLPCVVTRDISARPHL